MCLSCPTSDQLYNQHKILNVREDEWQFQSGKLCIFLPTILGLPLEQIRRWLDRKPGVNLSGSRGIPVRAVFYQIQQVFIGAVRREADKVRSICRTFPFNFDPIMVQDNPVVCRHSLEYVGNLEGCFNTAKSWPK